MGADRCQKIEEALQAFALDGAVKAYERYGQRTYQRYLPRDL